jgi:PLP dependent protein
MTTIAGNLQQVRDRMALACASARRPVQEVTLLAVSKTFGTDAVREAVAAGQRHFGENYIQEAVDKILAIRLGEAECLRLSASRHSSGVRSPQAGPLFLPTEWHCIGPVQSNKTRLVAAHFDWVHTVDRLKVAQRLSEQRPDGLLPLQVCLQVNVDGGAAKSGVAPDEVLALARAVVALPRLALRGLMTIPEPAADFAAQRAVHVRTRALFDEIGAQLSGTPGNLQWDTLSMGMSADLEAAIDAGSTLVRVGTAIFGGRDPAR